MSTPRPTCFRLHLLQIGGAGSGRLFSSAEGMSIDEVEKYLVYGMTHPEIIEYLSQTYGSVFVGDLIKRLPGKAPKPNVETYRR